MLGKLYKHELKETGKLIIPLNLVIIILSLMGAAVMGSRLFFHPGMEILTFFYMLFYILGIMAIFIVICIYFAMRFYKTMYGSPAYLTHTLPVSTGSILNTKIVISLCWMLVTMFITFLSFFAIMAFTVGAEWHSIVIETGNALKDEGFTFISFIIPLLFIWLTSMLNQLLMIYASLSIGQLLRQYRVLASIGTFVLLYIVQRAIETVIMFVVQFQSLVLISSQPTGSEFLGLFQKLSLASGIENTVLCILFYIACYYLTTKKLNLE